MASPWSGSDGPQRLRGQGRKQKIFGGADPEGEDVLRPLPAEGRPITLSPREPGSAATSTTAPRPSGGPEPGPGAQRRAPATAEPSSARCSSSSLDCGPGQRERDGAQAPALAPAPVAARAPPLASVPRCRGSRPHLRGGFDVGLDGWVIVVSRKSAAGTALRGRTHHSTPPSPLMSSGYGTPRQPRPRPIRVHTEEVTGSIPVSPTSTNAPFRSWEGAFDYRF